MPFAKVRRGIGKGGAELARDFLSPLEHHFLKEAVGATETAIFLSRFSTGKPFPGAAKAVREMARAGVRVVLASSAARSVVERSIALLRIGNAIAGFTSSDDVAKAKPFEDLYAAAIRRFRLKPSRTVAVGDTPYDVAAAHQVGLRCLAVRCGGFPARTLSRADRVYDDVAWLWAAEGAVS